MSGSDWFWISGATHQVAVRGRPSTRRAMGPPGSGARYLSPLGFDFGATRRPAVTLSTKRVTSYSQCLLLRLARHCCVRRIDFGAPNGHLTLMTHHRERGVVK